jgi:hypothetical protein
LLFTLVPSRLPLSFPFFSFLLFTPNFVPCFLPYSPNTRHAFPRNSFWYLLPSLYAIAFLNTLSSRSTFSTGSSGSGPSTNLKTTKYASRHPGAITFDLPTSPISPTAPRHDPSRSFFDAVGLKSTTGGRNRVGGGGGVGANTIQVEMHTVVVEESEKDLEAGIDSDGGETYRMEKLSPRERKEEWSD